MNDLIEQGRQSRNRILWFIHQFWGGQMYPPSVRQIAAGVGLSGSRVHDHLTMLREEGLLTWADGQYRTLRLTAAGEAFRILEGGSSDMDNRG